MSDIEPAAPEPPRQPRVLLADSDRARVADVLADAFAEGRLNRDEYDERLAAAMQARTITDLEPTLEGLPPAVIAVTLAPLLGSLAPAPGFPATPVSPSGATGWYSPGQVETGSPSVVAFFGAGTRKGQWVVPASMSAVAIFGGVELDFTRAQFRSEDVELTAVAVFGGVEITVPEGISVHVDGVGVFGGFDQGAEGPGIPGAPKLRIKGAAVFGGVEVKRKPRRAGGELRGPDRPALPGT